MHGAYVLQMNGVKTVVYVREKSITICLYSTIIIYSKKCFWIALNLIYLLWSSHMKINEQRLNV